MLKTLPRRTAFAALLLLGVLTPFNSVRAQDAAPAAKDKPLVSLVLLLKEPRDVTLKQVQDAFKTVLNVNFDPAEKPPKTFVIGESPSFLVNTPDGVFKLNNYAKPYVSDPEVAAKRFKDPALQAAFAQHKAWISVDIMGDVAQADKTKAYQSLGKVLAQFADDKALVVYAPEVRRAAAFTAKSHDALVGENPLAAANVEQAPAAPVDPNDPKIKAAVDEAKRRLPEFLDAFAARDDAPEPQKFLVKTQFTDAHGSEYLWTLVQKIENGTVTGTVVSDPAVVKSVITGDTVHVKREEVTDWLYGGKKLTGGFTEKLLEASNLDRNH